MANVVKIYEVKSLGYDQLLSELKNIDKAFEQIKKTKKELLSQKFTTDDATQLAKINQQLNEQRIKSRELMLQKQQLMNAIRAENIARIEEEAQLKRTKSALTAEEGSLTNLIEKRKQLKTLLAGTNPTSGTPILFGGQSLTYQQALGQYQAINGQITTMQSNFKNLGQVGNPIVNAINNGFQSMRGNLALMITQWAGWFALLNQTGQLIGENFKLSDSFADLQIRIHGTQEDVEQLVNSLKKIDTRSSLKDLVDIAAVVSKKGVAKEEIAGLTAEFDKLNVVLGKEIGDPSSAVASIIKLISIFNEDRNVTPQRVQELGTAMFKLTTSGVATGDFLIGFAERVGAIRGITGLTLPSILGLGAALQQLGQHEEVAGTAAVQLATRLFSNVPKFANAAKLSIQEFRDLLDKDPFEALVKVAEEMKNLNGDELAAQFEEVVTAFNDVGVTGARIKAVLGDIATNADFVRDRMAKAKVGLKDYADQSAAVELKQNTLLAVFQKVRKEFEIIFTSKPVQAALAIIGGLILVIAQNLGIILPILGLYSAAWVVANAEMIAARIEVIALNVALTFQRAILAITTTFSQAYAIALGGVTGATNAATTATSLWGVAMRLLPIGLILTFLALLFASCQRAASGIKGTTEELKKQAIQLRANQEINEAANQQIADQVSRMETLKTIVADLNISYDTRRKALEDMIAIDARFTQAISNQKDEFGNLVIIMDKVMEISKLYRAEIELNARATASASLTSGKYKEYLDVVTLRQKLETENAIQKTRQANYAHLLLSGAFSEAEQKAVTDIVNKTKGSRTFGIHTFQDALNALKDEEKARYDAYTVYQDVTKGYDIKLKEQAEANAKAKEDGGVLTLEQNIIKYRKEPGTETELDALLKAINDQISKLKEGSPKLAELQKARDEFKKRLDDIRGKNQGGGRPYYGARIPGEGKDELAIIDSLRDEELAQAELRQAERKQDHKLVLDEEINYVNEINKINQKYLDQKIKYLESQATLNAAEKKALATFKKDKLDLELKAQDDIQTLQDKEFAFQKRILDQQLRIAIQQEELKVKGSELDKSKTFTDRAKIREEADQNILKLTEKYNKDIDSLEKVLNQKSTENAQKGADDILKIKRELLQDQIEIYQAQIKDINEAADKVGADIQIRAAEATIKALQSGRGEIATAREIQRIKNQYALEAAVNEAARLKIELKKIEEGYNNKLVSEKEYQQAKAKYKEAEAKVVELTTARELTALERVKKALDDFVQGFKERVLQIKSYTKDAEGEAEKSRDAVTQAQDAIGEAIRIAYETYFERLKQRVDAERDAQKERLDAEEEQVKARAQSQAEIDAIEHKYDLKRKELDKRAAEEKKKIALKQLSIDFAVSIVKALAQFGLPLALIPIAAQTVLYFAQRAQIQSQTFAKGGIPKNGGQIVGPSHSQGGVKFHPMEAEGRELMIINKNSSDDNVVRTITGTNKQIASLINSIGGGVHFSPGATFTRRFADGGLLGYKYSAPAYSPTTSSGGQDIVAEIRRLADEQSKRIDRLEVVQVTKSVTQAQKKEVRQNSIGQL